MKSDYDAVVIGTGFGGAVAACRLAQAGLKVGIIERGRRYPKGSFQRDWKNPTNGWLWDNQQGLFDVKPINEMTVVQGAGYGVGAPRHAAEDRRNEGGCAETRPRSAILLSEYRGGFRRTAPESQEQVRCRSGRMQLLRRMRHRLQLPGKEYARSELPGGSREIRRRG